MDNTAMGVIPTVKQNIKNTQLHQLNRNKKNDNKRIALGNIH